MPDEVKDVKFTERELALLAGENPDAPADEPIADATQDNAAPAADVDSRADGAGPGTDAGKDAGPGGNAGQAADAAGGGKDAAADTSWLTDEDRELAGSYDLGADDLKQFGNADELRRALTLLDKQFVATAQKNSGQPDGQQATQPDDKNGQATQPATSGTKPAAPATPAADDDGFDLKKFVEGGYDDVTVGLAKTVQRLREQHKANEEFRRQAEQFQQSVTQHFEQQAAIQRINAFHDAADTLSEKRYGRSIDETGNSAQLSAEQDAARRKLWDTADLIVRGIVDRAREQKQEPKIPPQSVLLRRAELLAFADEIRKEEAEQRRETIASQSRRRRPAASSRPVSAAARQGTSGGGEYQDVNSLAKELANDPALAKVWDRITDESGKK